jgi:hypothetical protein
VKSDFAGLRQQIELESMTMKLAKKGLATVAKHEFITHKYDAIEKCQDQLTALVGEQGVQDENDSTTAAPLRQLTTPPMIDEAREIIRQHCCEVVEYPDRSVVTFPEGTIQTELLRLISSFRQGSNQCDSLQKSMWL